MYLCEDPGEAVRFTFLRGIKKNVVFGVMLDDKEVVESFDHNYDFFKCRAFAIDRKILADELDFNNMFQYDLTNL